MRVYFKVLLKYPLQVSKSMANFKFCQFKRTHQTCPAVRHVSNKKLNMFRLYHTYSFLFHAPYLIWNAWFFFFCGMVPSFFAFFLKEVLCIQAQNLPNLKRSQTNNSHIFFQNIKFATIDSLLLNFLSLPRMCGLVSLKTLGSCPNFKKYYTFAYFFKNNRK